ncbi:PRD domain-containing protein [Actinotalea sp. M2MS4P-6]|uniref:PRD domain-containing protein n=1 Tax=Actinotalea sp. M2MS4P-6 TaxID=2983762 RepID=UPI0021E4BC33|nr:PRD domain-containing protein [Actinotalea sp. M2MS4P-6]MCV2395740.1 PRD domain-containing protein [Actinotalea sp. M2MS4P-6]
MTTATVEVPLRGLDRGQALGQDRLGCRGSRGREGMGVKVLKVFNNNVVLGVDDHGAELVLLGRGLGFQMAPGAEIDLERVERRFVPSGATTPERIAAFVDEIPLADIELTERVVDLARQRLGGHVTENVLIPMADHLSFALRRAAEGAGEIEYPLQWEVHSLYPAEVAVAREALDLVAAERGVRLPDVEAVPLALHLVNAQFGAADLSTTVQMTELLREVIDIIESEYQVEIDEGSVDVARFVTHLRYLFVRQRAGKKLRETPEELHAALRSARPNEYTSAGRIGTLLADRFGWAVTTDEILYLALHVSRLVDAAVAGGGS